jgi:hypothetical protein
MMDTLLNMISRLLICVEIILTIFLSICFLFYLVMNYFLFSIITGLVTMTNLTNGLQKQIQWKLFEYSYSKVYIYFNY